MQPQSEKRRTELEKQFPCLEKLLKEREEKGAGKANINITVKRADPDFLYTLGENLDGANGSIFNENRPGEKGIKRDHLYTVGKDDEIISKWYYTQPDSRDMLTVMQIIDNGDEFLSKVAYFVWLTAYHWYKKPTEGQANEGMNLGEYLYTELYYTVHLPPDEGWRWLIETTKLTKNVTLYNRLLVRGYAKELNGGHKVGYEVAVSLLNGLARKFQDNVYLNGLKEIIDASKVKEMSGQFGEVGMLSYVLAGRIQFTLSDGTHEFTIIGEEGAEDPRMGYNSIYATYPTASNLVQTVIEKWEKADLDTRKRMFVDDKNVRIEGM